MKAKFFRIKDNHNYNLHLAVNWFKSRKIWIILKKRLVFIHKLKEKVNFLEYWYLEDGVMMKTWTWVTDIKITRENAMKLMKAGRARWKIENETFNTLKNQGYEFEHNFGHGYRHLSTNFALLMLLAFAVDQLQEMCCAVFQRAKEIHKSRNWKLDS